MLSLSVLKAFVRCDKIYTPPPPKCVLVDCPSCPVWKERDIFNITELTVYSLLGSSPRVLDCTL